MTSRSRTSTQASQSCVPVAGRSSRQNLSHGCPSGPVSVSSARTGSAAASGDGGGRTCPSANGLYRIGMRPGHAWPWGLGLGELSLLAAVRSLWASVQGDPVFMRRVNGWLTMFWIVMIPVSLITHWVSSVVYVSALSLWALVSGHWSAWQAARVEVNQDAEAKRRQDEDLAGEVVARLVDETEIQTA